MTEPASAQPIIQRGTDGKLYVWSDNKWHPEPQCFGLFWEDVPGNDVCKGCKFSEPCLDKFSKETLVQIQKKLGGKPTLAQLSAETGIGEVAIKTALRQAQPGVESSPRPTKAGASVVRAEAPAGKTVRTAGAAKAQAGQSRPGKRKREEKLQERWARERRRSLLRKIPIGTKLVTTYKGWEYTCELIEGGYIYNGRHYITLYEVTGEITGWREYAKQMKDGERPRGTRKMAAWSAERLWRLRDVVDDLKG